MVAVGAAVGCTVDRKMAPSAALTDDIESQLNLYSWGDYESPETLDAMREEFGFRLQVDSYGSNEELIAKLGAARGTSGYDIVVPTGVYIPQMVEHDLIQQLDHSRVPNLANLEPRFFNPEWNPESRHGACKAWGTTGFMYLKSLVDQEPTSWADFIEIAQGPAHGNVSVLADPFEVLSIANGALGNPIDTIESRMLDAARDVLLNDLAPSVKGYNSSVTSIVTGGGFSLVQAWNGDARLTLAEMDDPDQWGFCYPAPSANIWTDNFCIAQGTQHPGAAHAFINAMLDPETSYTEMDYIGYQTGVVGLRERAESEGVDFPELLFPTDAVLDRLVPSTVDEATERRTAILNEMQARSART